MTLPTLPGITSTLVPTSRLTIHLLSSGPADGTAVLFIHGNVSSATYWEETMLALPSSFRALAPDLRGYGFTDPQPINATLGLDEMVADLQALLDSLQISHYHLIGHSMGGGVAMKLTIANPANVLSLTLVDPVSPYGYSGSKGPDGAPIHDDGAPAGAGGVNPEFVRLLAEKERGLENPTSPRNVFRQFYVKPPFIPAREDVLVDSMLATHIGDDNYPGNALPSPHWPTVGPGERGVVNAFSRKYFDASAIVNITPQPPILWIRGSDDLIVSDNAFFDIAALGAMGFVPGYPGVDECPPQPMLVQTRAVLDQYTANGGSYQEVVIPDTGHSPYLEKPAEFNAPFHTLLFSQQ
jgi:pimeloyl-ACP methyl ester carboxylesterase